jgi:uncharacterized protein YqgC (DUF456 family)
LTTIAFILAILFFLAGLIGTVLPVLPGAVLIYGGMLLYGLMTHFTTLNLNFFLLEGVALLIVFVIDYLAAAAATKHFGGSKRAVWGAAAGTILGLIFLGPLGMLIGPFAGAVAAELLGGTAIKQTIRVGLGTLLGVLGGTVIKIGAEILMIVYFFIRI